MKKIMSLLLSVLMLFTTITAVPLAGNAAVKTKYGQNAQYEYCINNNETVTITSYKCKDFEGEVVIPSKIEGKRVTVIDEYAFASCKSITGVKVPDTVTEIRKGVFVFCYKLKKVSLPKNLKKIADLVFSDCVCLESIKIPDSVTAIGNGAFYNCLALENAELPKCLKRISAETFLHCESLTGITLPDSVTELCTESFAHCLSLKNIKIPGKVTKIGDSAFEGCRSLSKISLPNKVKEIKEGTFEGCRSLTSVSIPGSVTAIGEEAFYDCTALRSVSVPKSVTKIGSRAFAYVLPLDENNKTEPVFIIKGYSNTAAEKYAKKNKLKFVDLCSHKKTKTVSKKANYVEDGYKNRRICASCKKVLSKGKTYKKPTLKAPKSKISAGRKKITVKYTKVKGANGFQVKYTKGKKTVTKTFKTSKSATKTIAKLKKGKYKVQVRAYYMNSKKQKAYSPWTKAKSVTVK